MLTRIPNSNSEDLHFSHQTTRIKWNHYSASVQSPLKVTTKIIQFKCSSHFQFSKNFKYSKPAQNFRTPFQKLTIRNGKFYQIVRKEAVIIIPNNSNLNKQEIFSLPTRLVAISWRFQSLTFASFLSFNSRYKPSLLINSIFSQIIRVLLE